MNFIWKHNITLLSLRLRLVVVTEMTKIEVHLGFDISLKSLKISSLINGSVVNNCMH